MLTTNPLVVSTSVLTKSHPNLFHSLSPDNVPINHATRHAHNEQVYISLITWMEVMVGTDEDDTLTSKLSTGLFHRIAHHTTNRRTNRRTGSYNSLRERVREKNLFKFNDLNNPIPLLRQSSAHRSRWERGFWDSLLG